MDNMNIISPPRKRSQQSFGDSVSNWKESIKLYNPGCHNFGQCIELKVFIFIHHRAHFLQFSCFKRCFLQARYDCSLLAGAHDILLLRFVWAFHRKNEPLKTIITCVRLLYTLMELGVICIPGTLDVLDFIETPTAIVWSGNNNLYISAIDSTQHVHSDVPE